MKAKIVLNYADLKNTYLYRTNDRLQMFINASGIDGNCTYVDSNGTEYFYELENIFFKSPAESYIDDKLYTLEIQWFHRNPINKT